MTILKRDLPASLVVFLVALPLSLGIALASNAPMQAGIIAAVVGGIVVGLAGGAPLQVSGPAAGLTVVIFGMIQKYGFDATVGMVAASGVMQILLGLLKVGRFTLKIPSGVIHGMLAGIGILIALSQLHVILGHTPSGSGVLNVINLPKNFSDFHLYSTLLGFGTLLLLIAFKRFPGLTPIKVIPPSLIAVMAATIVSVVAKMDVARVTLDSGALFASFKMPQIPLNDVAGLMTGVVTLTVIASAESLLSAVATDKLHSGPKANLDRELMGQGAGNLISGLLGGLPITGVVVRSAANIGAGAQTRWSAVLHGVWVLVFTLLATEMVNMIPLAALAGLLVFVGANLVKVDDMRHLAQDKELFIYFITVGGVVFLNLLAGIVIGTVFYVVLLLARKQ